ncbi:hypothetical protein TorRG33x02_104950 [Trema orientale]|uniref:Uncharacterized protein n=1 Tax=Trema orientale TaxID=63057 RepID=A0A2P5F7L9_TREOI|nr:hypothetical protein TorRG33x02_104950 [Trema orientale]
MTRQRSEQSPHYLSLIWINEMPFSSRFFLRNLPPDFEQQGHDPNSIVSLSLSRAPSASFRSSSDIRSTFVVPTPKSSPVFLPLSSEFWVRLLKSRSYVDRPINLGSVSSTLFS